MKRFLSLMLAAVMIFGVLAAGAYAEKEKTFKNIIVMIGDGMGENSIEWTKAEKKIDAFMDSLPYKGYSKTNSYTFVTDSAAGGTALSSGYRAINSNVGTLAIPLDDFGAVVCTYTNSCEIAKETGRKAGIVTSDKNSGATPASFSAHVASRDMSEAICDQQLASNIDLIWGRADSYLTEEKVNASGWTYVDSFADVKALDGTTKSFGQFDDSVDVQYATGEEGHTEALLSDLTVKAIDLLDNDKGFFLMVEGAHIDKNNHSNNKEGMMNSLIEFDKAVQKAVEFAEKDGNTLVIVTADHETGKITFNESKNEYEYRSGGHTGRNVPLRVYGSDELVKDGAAVKNLEVSRFTAEKMGCTDYPRYEMNLSFAADLAKALFDWAVSGIKDLFED